MEQDIAYQWITESGCWTQSASTGAFLPENIAGVESGPSSRWTRADRVRHLGCRTRGARCGEDTAECGLFPREFEYCPRCRAQLDPPVALDRRAWLPPFGNEPGRQVEKNFSGLRLTHRKLQLAQDRDNNGRAQVRLPRTPAGDFHFLAAALGTRAAALIAIAPRDGKLLAFSESMRQWVEIIADETNGLDGSSLPGEWWTLVSSDLDVVSHCWVPTDFGLCKLTIDLVTLGYRAEYRKTGMCVGAPVALGSDVLVPCVGDDGDVVLVAVPMAGDGPSTRLVVDGIPNVGRGFQSAIGDPKKAFWETEHGQLTVRILPGGGGYRADFIVWPEALKPLFELGAPYCDRSGKLWRQCRNNLTQKIEYVELGSQYPDRFETDGPRTATGGLSFRLGVVIKEKDNPWDEVSLESHHQNKVIFPLVECDQDDVVVCAEIESVKPVEQLLASGERLRGRFTLRGSTYHDFYNFELSRPWLARVFVYDAHLYLYHPEWDQIPGWRLIE